MNITITLETLCNGKVRVTGRHDRHTVEWRDGPVGTEKALVEYVLSKTASAHRLPDGSYDFTYLELNPAARAALTLAKA